ncbi:MAG: O-acetylhomoserine aminocarboxypropyltransferase [Azospirillaceae bacterium]|nr:O-acetylhomoserine aminocarboxypropyltransferase [Azospirillaceae bacterium]
MSDNPQLGFETRAVHAGTAPDASTGARATPIYQTSSYVFESAEEAASLFALKKAGYIYSRLTNPTVAALEARLADLEGGRGATATASGHAAQLLALLPLLAPGDTVIASRKLYGGSINQLGHTFPRAFGWNSVFVDSDDPENFRRAVTPKTKAIFIESLANPGGVVSDVEAIARIADDVGVPLIVDNTLATPYLQRPIEYGATIVVHSTTKFLGGHGNSLGGIVIDSGRFDWSRDGRYPALTEPEPGYHGLRFVETFGDLAYTVYGHAVGLRDLGPCQAPLNAFLTLTGIETLPLRLERHSANALKVAQFLEAHPDVSWVQYAGLPSSSYHTLAQKYLPRGAGAVFTFGVRGGYRQGLRVVESVKIFSHLANVGDTRSLIIHPASTTHSQLSPEELLLAGAGPDVVRLSVGIENVDDLIADLDQALRASGNDGPLAG